jgi:hypothetical protein
MRTITGRVDCQSTKEIPVGSVIFITFSIEKKIVGRQTLQNLEHFPFEYRVNLEEDETQSVAGQLDVRVNIERGETTIFCNGQNGVEQVDLSSLAQQDHLDIQLHSYP